MNKSKKITYGLIILGILMIAGVTGYYLLRAHYRERAIIANMVYVDAGEITVGGNPACPWEGATRNLVVNPFYIDPYEVTNAEYKKFVDAGGYAIRELWLDEGWLYVDSFVDQNGKPGPAYWVDGSYPSGIDNHPVTGVCFYEAAAYAKWAGKALPTQWEWMAAAGWDSDKNKMREYPWGDKFDAKKCNTAENRKNTLMPVGSFPSGVSPYGCHDMAGNVLEWTVSYAQKEKESQRMRSKIALVILKGGAFNISGQKFARTGAIAFSDPPAKNMWPIVGNVAIVRKHPFYGFRCVYRKK